MTGALQYSRVLLLSVVAAADKQRPVEVAAQGVEVPMLLSLGVLELRGKGSREELVDLIRPHQWAVAVVVLAQLEMMAARVQV
jgi:hypothetical protein